MRETLKHIPPAMLEKNLTEFLANNHPSLMDVFKELSKKARLDARSKDKDTSKDFTREYSLDWTGPPFTIRCKSGMIGV